MIKEARYFVHYWRSATCNFMKQAYSGRAFNHTAGELLRKRGVGVGDFLYGWSYRAAELFLIARMQVGRFLSQKEADALYRPSGDSAWEASDHVLASSSTATPMSFDRTIPLSLVRRLEFISPQGETRTAKFVGGRVDPQTFRGLRELTRESALLLDRLIGSVTASAESAHFDRRSRTKSGRYGAAFGTPESNAEVEAAGIAFVSGWYRRRGWKVEPVESEKCGFDLRCLKRGAIDEVEVKGVTGAKEAFIITAGELRQAKQNPRFTLCVVTKAMSADARMTRYSGREFIETFKCDPIQFRAMRQSRG